MDRRHFLRMGSMTAVGLALGLAGDLTIFSGEAWAARGPSPDEAARAREIFDRVYGGRGAIQAMKGPGVYRLEPGGVLSYNQKGYCLDHQFGAPPKEEPLAYRPMTKYIAPELRQLYVGVMRRVSSKQTGKADIQKIVWAMRTHPSDAFTEGLRDADVHFLNSVMPGGAALLRRASRPLEFISGSGGSASRSGRGGGADVLDALIPQLRAQLPFNMRGHSDDLMRQLLGKQSQRAKPGRENAYSLLTASGVAGRSISLGNLKVDSVVVNGSNEAFLFDTTQWVLESPRDVQAVALPQITQASTYLTSPQKPGQTQPLPKIPDERSDLKAQQQNLDGQEQFYEFTNDPKSK